MMLHHHNQYAYVVGNSWQLQMLTKKNRKRLDSEPWVMCCNRFLSNWRQIGFRPTVWVYGDTGAGKNIEQQKINLCFRQELDAIRDDKELQEKLQYIFICIESEDAVEILKEYEFHVPITYYKRSDWLTGGQGLAYNLNHKIFHYGSTLTDVVNIAHILVGGVIKITGCQYMTRWGHFYDEPKTDEQMLPVPQSEMADRLWVGLAQLRNQGVVLLDCNFEHGKPVPEQWRLPRAQLF
jgi:hypothetical protein